MQNKLWFTLFLLGIAGCASLDDVDQDMSRAKDHTDSVSPAQNLQADELRSLMTEKGAYTPEPGDVRPFNDPVVRLGQMLFFDKIVSGGSDVACATCHHPSFGTSDGLPTSIGVGGSGFGPSRADDADGPVIPRNSPDLFNRGVELWATMFWDGRVSAGDGYFDSPAGPNLPSELNSVLAVQAMFPPTSPHEMRGEPGSSEIADIDGQDLQLIWDSLIAKILAIDEYVGLFADAYPDTSLDEIGFEHAATAIAAFEISAFTRLDTPFDRFLAGDDEALTDRQLWGAELFFGSAGCSDCHAGPLFTDQKAHALASPQLGPGKSDDRFDRGRELETGDPADAFAFRTPPLRNVELTGPYMHAGTYETLEGAIRHHIDPDHALADYTGDHLQQVFQEQLLLDDHFIEEVVGSISPKLAGCGSVNEDEVSALADFLRALTDDSARDLSAVIPSTVPSGLPVF